MGGGNGIYYLFIAAGIALGAAYMLSRRETPPGDLAPPDEVRKRLIRAEMEG